jgi:mRNA turnover protein 4
MGRRGPSKPPGNKKKKEDKIEQANQIRANLSNHERIYVIVFSSTKTDHQVDIRRHFRSSVLCLAKHSILAHALGTTEDTSALPEIWRLSEYLNGNVALFMTNEPHDDVVAFLRSLTGEEFATSGCIATDTFTVPAGPLPQFTFNMDSYLRELGLPVQLENGTIMNVRDHDVCVAGEPLSKNATKLLKQFGVKMATFSAEPIAFWQGGEVFTPK